MKNPLTLFSLFGIAIGTLGFVYPPSQKIILGVILLLCLGVIIKYVRERRPFREVFIAGGVMLPILVAALFYKFPADLVFLGVTMFFGSLFVISLFDSVSEKQKTLAAYLTFLGALVVAIALNYQSLLGSASANDRTTRHPNTEVPELAPFFTGDNFYYVGEFFLNYVYLMRGEEGKYFGRLVDGYCFADVHTAHEFTAIGFYDQKNNRFAVIDMQDPKFENLKLEELKFEAAPSDSLTAKAWVRASNPSAYKKDQKQGKRASWVFVDLVVEGPHTMRYYAEPSVHTEPKSGYKYFEIVSVDLQRFNFAINGKTHKYRSYLTDIFARPQEPEREMKMKDGDLPSAIWRLYETRAIE